MNKIINVSKEELELANHTAEDSSRRDFFRKTATYSVSALAAATLIAPVKINAEDDPAITEEKPWGTKFGYPVTHYL